MSASYQNVTCHDTWNPICSHIFNLKESITLWTNILRLVVEKAVVKNLLAILQRLLSIVIWTSLDHLLYCAEIHWLLYNRQIVLLKKHAISQTLLKQHSDQVQSINCNLSVRTLSEVPGDYKTISMKQELPVYWVPPDRLVSERASSIGSSTTVL